MTKKDIHELLDLAKQLYSDGDDVDLEIFLAILSAKNAYDLKLSDDEMMKLHSIIYNIWLKLEANESLQYEVDCIVYYMANENKSVDDIKNMSRIDLFEAIGKYRY